GSVCIAVAKASLTCMIDIFLCCEVWFKSHPKFKERGYFSVYTDRTPVFLRIFAMILRSVLFPLPFSKMMPMLHPS
ncbi:MAG: hypothetical protein KKD46_07190, partial [Euryarchaeota archaeon]|nr:hypothetical protein [Euryarchaeota archaeon]MBU4340684.1 hypothetical protein [Euryarchaeota archaeon]MBU4454338.1 hypothetical protein [Euryarchaeota archaeon]MCG2737338.1 hypothetical protein [Candidatus Methanoperedenaceae archaeon]